MGRITIRRGASVFGASALIGLALAGPATAKPMPGPNASPGTVTHGQEYISPDQQRAYESHYGPSSGSGVTAPTPVVKTITTDDGALDFLQIGAGALAGFALAGATTVAMGKSHRRQALQA
jgi:hypothetical protein